MRTPANPPSISLRLAAWIIIPVAVLLMSTNLLALVVAPSYIASQSTIPQPNITWTPEATRSALAQLGWSPQVYRWFEFILQALQALPFVVLAAILLWRRSNTWMGLIMGLTIAVNSLTLVNFARDSFPWLGFIYDLLGNVGWQAYFIPFYVFPDGRFVPRWTRWFLLGWLAVNLYPGAATSFSPIVMFVTMLLVFTALGSQVYRYFKVADAVQRQQTKWVLFSVILILFALPIALSPFLVPAWFTGNGGSGLLMTMGIRLMDGVVFSLFPISLVIAIFRYRLWDIDLIIRRTLVYGLLTGLLALFYFGSVVVLQQLLRGLTGQSSDLAIIISTLAIAALSIPLRNRVQRVIDQRFYRRKYNAAQVLAAFAATVRDEVDLGRLTDELQTVVQETMQPEQVSLWLKANSQKNSRGLSQ